MSTRIPTERIFLLIALFLITSVSQGQNTVWTRTIGDIRFDAASHVAVDPEGNVIVIGTTQTSTSFDVFTAKFDPSGKRLWLKQYDSSGTDTPRGLAVDANGQIFVACRTSGAGTLTDITLLKYASNGNFRWVRRYDGASKYDSPNGIAVDPRGNVGVTGHSQNAQGDYDEVTLSFDTGGNLRWKVLEFAPDYVTKQGVSITFDSDGNALVGSTTSTSLNTDEMHIGVIKYNAKGTKLWTRGVVSGSTAGKGQTRSVATDADGNVYVTGILYSEASGSYDIATLKYDRHGNLIWNRSVNGGGFDDPISMEVGPDRSVWILATTDVSGENDYLTVKLGPNGRKQWSRRYNGPGNGRDYPYALCVDAFGNAIVTGAALVATDNYDPVTIKYDPLGNILWRRRHQRVHSLTNDRFYDVAVDASGNVYVVGQLQESGTNYSAVVMKLSP